MILTRFRFPNFSSPLLLLWFPVCYQNFDSRQIDEIFSWNPIEFDLLQIPELFDSVLSSELKIEFRSKELLRMSEVFSYKI